LRARGAVWRWSAEGKRARQGKTTIVKLLTRLYDPTAGQILLDGRWTCGEYDLEDLWKETGVIFQDFMRYDMTAGGEETSLSGKEKSKRSAINHVPRYGPRHKRAWRRA